MSECLGIKAYITGEKLYLSTNEILCDTLADGDEGKYFSDLVPWIHKDAFGRFFLTLPGTSIMEICHPAEFFRFESSCSYAKYYLLGLLDNNKVLDSIVTRKENIFEISSRTLPEANWHFHNNPGRKIGFIIKI